MTHDPEHAAESTSLDFYVQQTAANAFAAARSPLARSGSYSCLLLAEIAITDQTRELEQSQRMAFSAQAYAELNKLWLESPDIPDDELLAVSKLVAPSLELAETLVGAGTRLSQSPITNHRGQLVLAEAATVCEEVYVDLVEDQPMIDRLTFLQNSYYATAAARLQAGDRDGSVQTAIALAPHIITLSGQAEDLAERRWGIDSLVSQTASLIGSLDVSEARQLTVIIEQEDLRDLALSSLLGNVAVQLLEVRQLDLALELNAGMEAPNPAVWQKIVEMLESEDVRKIQTGLAFLDKVHGRFPEFYQTVDGSIAPTELQKDMVRALFVAKYDVFLAQALASFERNADEPAALEHVAFYCGEQNDLTRLSELTRQLEPTDSRRNRINTHYERGQQTAQDATKI